MTNSTVEKTIYLNLGYIGNSAEKLQNLFDGYSTEPNENGFFLKFINYSDLVWLVEKKGVGVETNCFKKKKLKEEIFSRLLLDL